MELVRVNVLKITLEIHMKVVDLNAHLILTVNQIVLALKIDVKILVPAHVVKMPIAKLLIIYLPVRVG